MFQSNLLWKMVNRAAVIGMFMISLTACNPAKTTSQLRVTEPSVYETKTKGVARIGEIMHSNRTKVNGSDDVVTHEIELAGIHSGYGAVTVVNMIYRKLDASRKNIGRPKVISHKLSEGMIVNLGGAKIELIKLKTDTVEYIVKQDFNEVLNR
ncbi:hypothetical protein OAJ84_03460 [Candidatus Puniceispirillum sp.]|nr:hypothetical protein [Candidatus Puniceispirillum sp.]